MARRSRDWEESVANDLRKNKNYRKELFLALLEEGYEWKEALNRIIKLIGVNEYAEMVGDMKASNLINQLKPTSNMTIGTLERITKPLGIVMTFAPALKKIV